MVPTSTRRRFIGGSAALAACCGTPGLPGPARTGAIDIHHHLFPPAYLKARGDEVAARSRGFTQVLEWTPEKSLAEMDAAGTRLAVLSMTAPVWFGDPAEARALAREANQFAAGLMRDHPGRFGAFATLPLPDVDGALSELAHALDELGAHGVGLLSNYGNAYLGDPRFEPLLQELDRRGAVAYVHPTVASCCQNLVPQIPPAFLELPFDSSRTITSLLYSGALSRFPRIRWIFSHGGGTIPFLADRVAQWGKARPDLNVSLPHGALAELRRLNFDTASVTNRPALAAIGAFVPWSQVLFGTDYPYVGTRPQLDELTANVASGTARELIRHGNAERLMPGLVRP
ncbi:amidohydrolase [Novosphingobium flavum]|uniref:amidohydrolase family protein n=1 Tax=Novosphingobium aerophilum TaxID=2839843 RepID=UPI0016397E22|nr:amidohydrolase family protein [Novosphingobium aerophilum]MBC2661025.1 amidohydrolase [Novosphingobium aerophilum]